MKISVLDKVSNITLNEKLGLTEIKGLKKWSTSYRTYRMLNHRYAIYRFRFKINNQLYRMLHTLTHSKGYWLKYKNENYYEYVNSIPVGKDDAGNEQLMSEEILLVKVDKNIDLSEFEKWQNKALIEGIDKAMHNILRSAHNKISMDPDYNNALEKKILKQVDDDTFAYDD